MKKLLLFASLAMAAVAFTGPSSASATWTDQHVVVPNDINPQLHGEGNWFLTVGSGGIHCSQVTATLQLTGGTTTGHMVGFSTNVASCKSTGDLAGCTLTSSTPEGFPWTSHIGNTKLSVLGTKVSYVLHGLFCPQKTLTISPIGAMLLQPQDTAFQGQHTTISAFLAQAQVTVVGSEDMQGTAHALITLTPSSSHRFGWT